VFWHHKCHLEQPRAGHTTRLLWGDALEDSQAVRPGSFHACRDRIRVAPLLHWLLQRIMHRQGSRRKEYETLVRATGLDVGRTARIGDAGPWITGDPAQDFLRFEHEGLFSSEFAVGMLRAATEKKPLQARADAEIFVPGMRTFARLFAARGAPEVSGWFFNMIDVEDDATFAQVLVMMLLGQKLVSLWVQKADARPPRPPIDTTQRPGWLWRVLEAVAIF
jgi:hypothetical protein